MRAHRWGFKFFDSEAKDVLLDEMKKRMDGAKIEAMHDMSSPAADIVHQELETLAANLKEHNQLKQRIESSGALCQSDVRCENFKSALRSVLGDGLRDGSFFESIASKDAGGVTSRASVNHVIYLFSSSKGQDTLQQTVKEVVAEGLTKEQTESVASLALGLKDEAKLLSEAFQKFSVLLQWVDTVATVASIKAARAEEEMVANDAEGQKAACGTVAASAHYPQVLQLLGAPRRRACARGGEMRRAAAAARPALVRKSQSRQLFLIFFDFFFFSPCGSHEKGREEAERLRSCCAPSGGHAASRV